MHEVQYLREHERLLVSVADRALAVAISCLYAGIVRLKSCIRPPHPRVRGSSFKKIRFGGGVSSKV